MTGVNDNRSKSRPRWLRRTFFIERKENERTKTKKKKEYKFFHHGVQINLKRG
jgi:hypothetical protein